jgi:hypothetical protein
MGSSRPVPVSTKANQNRENKTVRVSYAIARRRVIAIGAHCGRARQSIPQEEYTENGATASAAPHSGVAPPAQAAASDGVGWGRPRSVLERHEAAFVHQLHLHIARRTHRCCACAAHAVPHAMAAMARGPSAI